MAPRRASRPASGQDDDDPEDLPQRDPECPFCPGNEDELPEIVWEIPWDRPPGWCVRAVPNRYPAFRRSEGAAAYEGLGPPAGDAPPSGVPAVGRQEVLIESPRHNARLAGIQARELEAVVTGHHARYRVHAEEDPEGTVILFRNHGHRAGASLLHPHSQLVVLPYVPPVARERIALMEAYHRDEGGCILCAEDGEGPGRARRVVMENEGFRALVPWAAEVPMEVWIVPRRHQAGFQECTVEERGQLARVMKDVLERYRTLAGDPAYNYLLRSAPRALAGHPAHHWFAQLRPRVHQMAGFELGSGIVINPSLPEEDARTLREAK